MPVNLTKHMQSVVDKEEKRIRDEIASELYRCLSKAGYVITVSQDSVNRTERGTPAKSAFMRRMNSEHEHGHYTWAFAYANGTADTRKAKPAAWVQVNTDN